MSDQETQQNHYEPVLCFNRAEGKTPPPFAIAVTPMVHSSNLRRAVWFKLGRSDWGAWRHSSCWLSRLLDQVLAGLFRPASGQVQISTCLMGI